MTIKAVAEDIVFKTAVAAESMVKLPAESVDIAPFQVLLPKLATAMEPLSSVLIVLPFQIELSELRCNLPFESKVYVTSSTLKLSPVANALTVAFPFVTVSFTSLPVPETTLSPPLIV